MINLFVYGTLKDKSVRNNILGRNVESKPDVLYGYSLGIHPVLTSYPVVFKSDDGVVYGEVFKVSEQEFELLDRYESQYYVKEDIILESDNKAKVYVVNNQMIENSDQAI
jgi:gamma-glutamylcyclotransferase (GGCT)/AIG2-like uncharacterized protein YtfP